MKNLNVLPRLIVIMIAMSMAIIGCGSAANGAPSASDVKSAVSVVSTSTSSVPMNGVTYTGMGPYTFSTNIVNPAGGSVAVNYASNTNPYAGPWTTAGTIVFTNWHDPGSGYTINGTVSLSDTCGVELNNHSTYPRTETATATGELALSCGKIFSLGYDFSETITLYNVSPYIAVTASGTVTANGYVFDIATLLP